MMLGKLPEVSGSTESVDDPSVAGLATTAPTEGTGIYRFAKKVGE